MKTFQDAISAVKEIERIAWMNLQEDKRLAQEEGRTRKQRNRSWDDARRMDLIHSGIQQALWELERIAKHEEETAKLVESDL